MAGVDRQLAQRIVDFLNGLLELEPATVHRLITHQFRCGAEFAKHPSVQVWSANEAQPYPRVTLLGLLNGLVGVDDKGCGAVAVTCKMSDDGHITDIEGFEVLRRG